MWEDPFHIRGRALPTSLEALLLAPWMLGAAQQLV
jgi:hypothetical protein